MNKKATDVTQGILAYLKKENLIDQTEEIAQHLISLAKAENKKVLVESAKELNGREEAEIGDLIAQNWNGFEKIEFRTDPELLGGLKVTLGDKVLDLSVKSRLQKIYEQV